MPEKKENLFDLEDEAGSDSIEDGEDFDAGHNDDFRFLEDELESGEGHEEEKSDDFSEEDPSGKRFEYWQSQADKYKSQLAGMQKELEKYSAVAPIAKFLEANPQAIGNIENFVAGSENPKAPTVEKPKAPVKPKNFSFLEADEDPGSASAKYLSEREAYMDAVANYYTQKEEQREAELEQIHRAQTQREVKTKQMKEVAARLQGEFELSPADANLFIAEMDSPESLSLENLVEFWKWKNGSTADLSEAEKKKLKAENLRRRKTLREKNLAPGGGAGGEGSGKDDASSFVSGLKTTGRNLFETK